MINNNNINEESVLLKVSGHTDHIALSTSIVGNLLQGKVVLLDCIGVSANYIAVKSVITTRGSLLTRGKTLVETQFLHEIKLENPIDTVDIKTGIRWILSIQQN